MNLQTTVRKSSLEPYLAIRSNGNKQLTLAHIAEKISVITEDRLSIYAMTGSLYKRGLFARKQRFMSK